jgi:hypothetical protein
MSKGPVVQSCNVDGRGGGCKAAREKVRLGNDRRGQSYWVRSKQSFSKAFETNCCVLCDFNSYESDRKGEKLENFLHGAND